VAEGFVYNSDRDSAKDPVANIARLAFNYQGLEKARELEVLHYSAGVNWMDGHPSCASHFGMHIAAKDIEAWKRFFRNKNISIVQEVNTLSHSNPVIAGKRSYNYIIFGTRQILGVDLKLIVRIEKGGAALSDADDSLEGGA